MNNIVKGPKIMTNNKSLHELAKDMLSRANVEVLRETGKLKEEENSVLSEATRAEKMTRGEDQKGKSKRLHLVGTIKGVDGKKFHYDKNGKKIIEDETIGEGVSRKHFQQVADVIKAHPDPKKRQELAAHHSEIFARQNPRFDKHRFHKAADAELKEEDITELSKETLTSYEKKATKNVQGIVRVKNKLKLKEGVSGEHGPDDDEDSLDRIERKKQDRNKAPFKPDKAKSTDWSSARSKAKNLARTAMKKAADKKKITEGDDNVEIDHEELLMKAHGREAKSKKAYIRKLGTTHKFRKHSVHGLQGQISSETTKGTLHSKLSKGKITHRLEEENIQELSDETLKSYGKKAERSAVNMMRGTESKIRTNRSKFEKRIKGIVKAKRKLKEEDVQELSNETLKKYGKKLTETDIDKTPVDMLSTGPKIKKQDALVNEVSKETLISYKSKVTNDMAKQHNAGRYSKVFGRLQGSAKASMRLQGVTPQSLHAMKKKLANET